MRGLLRDVCRALSGRLQFLKLWFRFDQLKQRGSDEGCSFCCKWVGALDAAIAAKSDRRGGLVRADSCWHRHGQHRLRDDWEIEIFFWFLNYQNTLVLSD